MAFFFHYQGAKGDRGMTGDAGEKGEQVKREFSSQQCIHCDCPFMNNPYGVCRRISFSEAEKEDGSSSSLINLKCAVSGTVAVLHRLPSLPPIKAVCDVFHHL